MRARLVIVAMAACAMISAQLAASRAEPARQELKLVTPPLSMYRDQIRPRVDALPVPAGFSRDQILHGDRVFHGEAANGQCSVCHGVEIPARAGCVKGRRMATVGKCRFDLEVCGGIYVNKPCVVDGNLVSGRTFHDHGQYMGAWIKLLLAERQRLASNKT